MKIRKRIASLFCAAALAAAMLTGCTGGTAASSAAPSEAPSSQEASEPEEVSSAAETETTDDTTIRIGALKGPTGLGMLQLMQEANDGKKPYEFTLAGAADELTGKITTGELDAVALPTNTAATLYNKTEGALQIAMVNTLGVLYLVTSGDTEITSVSDLAGKNGCLLRPGHGGGIRIQLHSERQRPGSRQGCDRGIQIGAFRDCRPDGCR